MASAIFIAGAGVVALLLWMTFWGSDTQAAMALDMLKYVFVAVGGAGVFTAARATISFFMRGDDD